MTQGERRKEWRLKNEVSVFMLNSQYVVYISLLHHYNAMVDTGVPSL